MLERGERLMDSKTAQFSFPNHYNICEEENGYSFKTDSGNIYYVTFIKYPVISEYLSVDVFMLNIYRADEHNHQNGDNNLVRNTILYIICRFFILHDDALITICDIADGRQLCRRRLFNRWFKEFSNGELIKLDATLDVEGCETYASMLFRADLENRASLEKEFSLLSDINFYT